MQESYFTSLCCFLVRMGREALFLKSQSHHVGPGGGGLFRLQVASSVQLVPSSQSH